MNISSKEQTLINKILKKLILEYRLLLHQKIILIHYQLHNCHYLFFNTQIFLIHLIQLLH